MPNIKITCPHCGFSREFPQEKIPTGSVRVTCPNCRERFLYPQDTASPFPSGPGPKNAGTGPSEEHPRGMNGRWEAIGEQAPTDIPGEETGPASGSGSRPVLRDLGTLFRDSWEIYLQRIGTLMGLYLLSIGLMFGPVALFGGIGALAIPFAPDLASALIGAGVITGCLVGSFGLFWGIAGLVCAVGDQSLGIKAALGRAGERYWGFLWIFSLVGYLISGGFLLFVVPGILFSIWFMFGQFILADEGIPGMSALMKSKAYTEGYFFEVFIRLLLVWAASSLLGLIPIAGPLLSILFMPYMMIFLYLIYADLRAGRAEIVPTGSQREKVLWILVGSLGYIIIPVGALLLFGASIMQIAMQLVSGV